MLGELKESYGGVFEIFGRYWSAYGGWKAVFFSPYFHGAIVLTAVLAHAWVKQPWWSVTIAVLPTLVGFAIGAYSIVLGFGDDRFRDIIMERDEDGPSPYVEISASFAHFIVVQLLALIVAFVANGLDFPLDEKEGIGAFIYSVVGSVEFVHDYVAPVGYFFGYLLFMYAITTALATAMAIFRLTTLAEREKPAASPAASDDSPPAGN
ncbi:MULTISPECIES: hypothetical protein [Burkholderia]|uniref:Uncharacterized protein n=1 Tax=Burkholderia paludis TaxID=1506587 RepID=A0A6J5D957_9BURK|nr:MULTISPECIES: hypothetical protein [Burkholderia]CAB3750869.1 hypothetical protein LMG30113_01315 [Burkholderia paludis]VWB09933.1 hypothetical protein BPA30113_00162 [Burkholderia paludis]